jgi:DNA-binding NarL/FixJ family response regulator
VTLTAPPGSDVLGRDEELAAIARFLANGPTPAAALVLEGEAGIGKTTLWLHAVAQAVELPCTVLSSRPAESDEQLSFAGLGDLLSGVLDRVLPELPAPQRSALEVALLLADEREAAPDPGKIAFAFLSAIRALARESPVALAIDDVQWLDAPSAQLVRFAAQRLQEEPVCLIVARRGDGRGRAPLELERALPQRVVRLRIGPLSLGALHELLRTRLGTSFARPTLRRLHEASGGNPFYALEIGRVLEQHGGHLELGGALPVPEDLDELLSDRLRALPEPVREALLVAALSSEPTPALVESTAGRPIDLQAAIEAKVITLDGGKIQFAHPLLTAAIQHQAGAERTRRVHLSLSRHAPSAEERALHLALGTSVPDARAANALAEAARAAQGRGAPMAAAAFFEHALRVSDPAQPERVRWGIELARACFEAGDPARSTGLLNQLSEQAPAGRERAEVLLRLAMVTRSNGAAPATWLGVAEEALPEAAGDPVLEAAIHTEVSWAALFVNDLQRALAHARTAVELAERIDDAEVAAQALDSLVYMELTAGIVSPPELIERALELERAAPHILVDLSPSLGRGFQLCSMGDLAAARLHLLDIERLTRERGDESGLAVACGTLTTLETLAGNWEQAEAYARETVELSEHTGVNWHESLHARALLDAHLGSVDRALTAARELVADAEEGGSLLYLVRSLSVLGFIELSRGDLDAARAALGRATEAATALGIGEPGLLRCVPDQAETLAALGECEAAERLIEPYEAQATALGRSWAQATSERCRGLVLAARGDLPEALETLERAAVGHRQSPMPFELGRTLLALGSAQRRARQRRAARESLTEALTIFDGLGAPLWADKARAELGRIGGRTPAGESLTPAEARIAELVADGLTNREAAAELVVAVHTIEAALTRIYAKLGVRSRTELARQFAGRSDDGSGVSLE